MEQLQLEVKSLIYKQDEEQIKNVVKDLEIAEDTMGKSRVQVVKLIIKTIDGKLEEDVDPATKFAFLKGI